MMLIQMQEAYDEYCLAVRQEYSDEFWRVLSTVYLEQTAVIDRVLKTCRSVFMPNKKMKALFDPSVRLLRARSLFIYDYSYVFDEGVIVTILPPKLIRMVMVVQGRSYGVGGTSNSQRKEYLMVSCISQDKYNWPVIFICTTRPPRRRVTGST